MQLIALTPWDLALAGALVLALAATAWPMRLELARPVLVAAARTVVQLALVGLVLETVFARGSVVWVGAIALAMLLLAGREASARQARRLAGGWSFAGGTLAMFLSSFVTAVLALTIVIQPEPWHAPQYAIPLLGMLLGNTMTGVALGMDRLTSGVGHQRAAIEARLTLGDSAADAIEGLRRDAVRAGMIPTLNAMAAAGIVSLPGMMTGQILAGAPPWEAVKYQILIMFLIAAGTGFGTLTAVWLAVGRLSVDRDRLRLDRLR